MRTGIPVLLLALLATACSGTPPATLGPTGESGAQALAACPDTPNCVHTGLRHPDGTQGLVLAEDWPDRPEAALDAIAEALEAMPRTEVVEREGRYLRAEATSRIFRFVDDVEVHLAMDGQVVVRSASRVGRSDMGVNAERVAELRGALERSGVVWSVP